MNVGNKERKEHFNGLRQMENYEDSMLTLTKIFSVSSKMKVPDTLGGRGKDGRGIGWGDHFLPYKFIKRTLER